MDDLDKLLEEMMTKGYGKIIENEDIILKKLGSMSLKEFYTLDKIATTTKTKSNTSNNIARILDITPGTLTTNLDRLAAKGYISREKAEDDKRKVFVYLTPVGIQLLKRRNVLHKKIIRNIISKLSGTEKVALISALNKIDYLDID